MPLRFMGVETEYALTAVDREGKALDREVVARRLLGLAKRRLLHLPDANGYGMFLSNGSRFYVDYGLHPELATPECTTPYEAVRYVEAGHRILAGLLKEMRVAEPNEQVNLLRCNVDYSGVPSTWGCHESYMHRVANPVAVPPQIVPHLVSRIIYTGAGGFNPLTRRTDFVLSPRAFFIERRSSSESTHRRGIFHTKDEPLGSGGYHRLHIVFGESLCSQTAAFLKVGATALVVAMIEAGVAPTRGLVIPDPLAALRKITSDVTCRTTVAKIDAQPATAIGVQRNYLKCAEKNLRADFMPSWAPEVCALWRQILDRLEEGAPDSVCTTLDWAIKQALYANRFDRDGWAPEHLRTVVEVVERIGQALGDLEVEEPVFTLEQVASPESPIPDTAQAIEGILARQRLGWSDVDRYIKVRDALFEADMRFGELGDDGVFARLDTAGVLDHSVPGVGDIRVATSDPPPRGRPRVRGNAVRRLRGKSGYCCDWHMILGKNKMLDLSDPSETEEQWKDSTPHRPGDSENFPAFLRRLRSR